MGVCVAFFCSGYENEQTDADYDLTVYLIYTHPSPLPPCPLIVRRPGYDPDDELKNDPPLPF